MKISCQAHFFHLPLRNSYCSFLTVGCLLFDLRRNVAYGPASRAVLCGIEHPNMGYIMRCLGWEEVIAADQSAVRVFTGLVGCVFSLRAKGRTLSVTGQWPRSQWKKPDEAVGAFCTLARIKSTPLEIWIQSWALSFHRFASQWHIW